ncbi:unnamed protein product [Sphagnum jensenii]|uniref:Flavanone 4-reductase n=1 Tax=Sphagnum jensenii TaxID=128206 RepID=A0ABP0VR75_9BRYO
MISEQMQPGDLCLVTGGSGFLASWIEKYLLEGGYKVRGTVRSLQDKKLETLRDLLPGVEFVEADLREERGWTSAVEGCKWVFHVATPQATKSEKNRTSGALSGTKHVMAAALASNTVKKIVVTSSEAAIAYGHPRSKSDFSEDDWSIGVDKFEDYMQSKTVAEKKAWEMANDTSQNPQNIALSTINPSLVLGPTLVPWSRFSLSMIQDIAEGRIPLLPNMSLHVVDVRDCARMHIAIMHDRSTDGHRHLSFGASGKFVDLAIAIRTDYADRGFKPSTSVAPWWVLWLPSFFSKDVATIYSRIGNFQPYRTKYPEVYKYEFTSFRDIVRASMDSILEHKWINPKV